MYDIKTYESPNLLGGQALFSVMRNRDRLRVARVLPASKAQTDRERGISSGARGGSVQMITNSWSSLTAVEEAKPFLTWSCPLSSHATL